MKKSKLKLSLNKETIRRLAGHELQGARGGQEPLSGPIDVCRPPSNGTPTCTTCTVAPPTQYTNCGSCDWGTEG
jgi:hypothetical protein